VVAAVEDEHLRSAGELPSGRDRHQVCLGARVREADAVEPEPLAHQPRKLGLLPMKPADARELAQRAVDGVEHAPLAVPEEPGRVVAEQVDVLVPVRVDEHGALAAHERQRERLVRKDRPRVPAGQDTSGLVVKPLAFWVPHRELAPLLGDELRNALQDGAQVPILAHA
jgi:hypothetical protein